MEYLNYVGIDMAKASFFACLAEGQEARQWNNNTTGIKLFFNNLAKNDFTKNNTILGVESTSCYHFPICIKSQKLGYKIKVINPLITKKQNQTTLRRVKNDPKDAKLIRYCLAQGNGYLFESDQEQIILKTLIRQRSAISQNKNKIKTQRDNLDFKEKAINTKINNIYDELFEILEEKQKQIEKELSKYNKETQTLLQSIPGVGPVTAASFISEIIDIKRFKHPKQLTAYCGIDPRVYESGTSIKGKGYITKRGSKILRTILYNATSVAVLHDNMFKDFFQRKRDEGKPYRVALVATMRKMVHVIHAVWTRGTPFQNQNQPQT